jgi:hypothetical protein
MMRTSFQALLGSIIAVGFLMTATSARPDDPWVLPQPTKFSMTALDIPCFYNRTFKKKEPHGCGVRDHGSTCTVVPNLWEEVKAGQKNPLEDDTKIGKKSIRRTDQKGQPRPGFVVSDLTVRQYLGLSGLKSKCSKEQIFYRAEDVDSLLKAYDDRFDRKLTNLLMVLQQSGALKVSDIPEPLLPTNVNP